MLETEAREAICAVGASLYARGYVHGTTGNISVKLADGVLITPTDVCLGTLDPSAISKVANDGTHLSGDRPSKAVVLHGRIYAADDTATCVIHTHSRQLVAASMRAIQPGADLLPPITPYFVMKVGHVPMIACDVPGSQAVAQQVYATIVNARDAGAPIRAVMLERLGPNIWHTSPERAMAALEELEETAYLWNAIRPEPLGEQAIADLCSRFGIAW